MDNFEERNKKRSRCATVPPLNSISPKQSIPTLLNSSTNRSNQTNLDIAATTMTHNFFETNSGNLIEPMDGVEMEELEEETAVEDNLTLINITGAAKKGTSSGARPSQA
ncbi:uncharacterized protein LOC113357199 [Papaver somniferum]|uniref:uncharacterized protein LOC113357199 n=1 Tax=Papaver somniferum TaxID=3469 RepID=UPI000E6FE735|nr:uncharacterized protein LOC113357199 [Papaver somniferum]